LHELRVDSQPDLATSVLCLLEAVEVLPLSLFVLRHYVLFKSLVIPRVLDFGISDVFSMLLIATLFT
jgi:hypothetical protein